MVIFAEKLIFFFEPLGVSWDLVGSDEFRAQLSLNTWGLSVFYSYQFRQGTLVLSFQTLKTFSRNKFLRGFFDEKLAMKVFHKSMFWNARILVAKVSFQAKTEKNFLPGIFLFSETFFQTLFYTSWVRTGHFSFVVNKYRIITITKEIQNWSIFSFSRNFNQISSFCPFKIASL